MKYWISIVSRDHVRGVVGGFTQANHGKLWALRKMSKGDKLIFYSLKTHFEDGEPLQSFTALGEITDDEPYQAEMGADFHPWRCTVRFEKIQEVPIRCLIDKRDFIAIQEALSK